MREGIQPIEKRLQISSASEGYTFTVSAVPFLAAMNFRGLPSLVFITERRVHDSHDLKASKTTVSTAANHPYLRTPTNYRQQPKPANLSLHCLPDRDCVLDCVLAYVHKRILCSSQ